MNVFAAHKHIKASTTRLKYFQIKHFTKNKLLNDKSNNPLTVDVVIFSKHQPAYSEKGVRLEPAGLYT